MNDQLIFLLSYRCNIQQGLFIPEEKNNSLIMMKQLARRNTDVSVTLISNMQNLRPERQLHVKIEVHQSQVQGPAPGVGQFYIFQQKNLPLSSVSLVLGSHPCSSCNKKKKQKHKNNRHYHIHHTLFYLTDLIFRVKREATARL